MARNGRILHMPVDWMNENNFKFLEEMNLYYFPVFKDYGSFGAGMIPPPQCNKI
jgi:hypothetical protein